MNPYRPQDWRFISGTFMLHVPTETVFQIEAAGEVLQAKIAMMTHEILVEDADIWTEHAVPAYLNAIGFKKRARHKVPKPN